MTDSGVARTPEEKRTKSCGICFEAIHADALACRFCGHPQGRLHGWWYRHSMLPVLIIFLMMLFLPLWTAHVFTRDRGVDFAPYRDSLRVVSTKMTMEPSDRRPFVLVVGTVRNESSIPWERLQFEVQFMDASGELIDVARDVQFREDPGILPGTDRPFALKTPRDFPPDRYASARVLITFARDGRASP